MPTLAAHDPYNLQRFLDAQTAIYAQAYSELAGGKKRTHWMWFIFPQIHGLGSSPTAQHFAISGIDEAVAYLNQPLLGVRLHECTALVNALEGRSIHSIFGSPDDLKFHSSITLFAQAEKRAKTQTAAKTNIFSDALTRYFQGVPDENTVTRLG